jgi:hypothetical protein
MAALQNGDKCPDRGPYLLVVNQVEPRVNWKDELVSHLAGEGQSEAEIAATIAAIENREREKVSRLECKTNANYRRAFPIRLPS